MYKGMEFHDSILRVNTLLNAKDVAEILQISRAMAYTMMQRWEIPTVRIGKCRRVRLGFNRVHKQEYILFKPTF
jgi:predicted DNA-binding transcriptional regulator AlpA